MPLSRYAPITGIAGPAAFIGAWVSGGLVKDGYSPAEDTISRLAEEGASTRALMTAGFVGFGVLMPVYARELGHALGSPGVRAAVTVSAVGTLVVAAFPVTAEGGTTGDTVHYIAAGISYAANVLAPLAAARRLPPGRGRRASYAVAAAIAAALVGSVLADSHVGLLQRTGLTLFDAWAAVFAGRLLAAGRNPASNLG
jgi:hypothetical membrane protein